jgi:hypothetical protein
MDLTLLETLVLDEWIFIPAVLLILLNSFGIGLVLGFIWVAL